jgi:hypothetical protein
MMGGIMPNLDLGCYRFYPSDRDRDSGIAVGIWFGSIGDMRSVSCTLRIDLFRSWQISRARDRTSYSLRCCYAQRTCQQKQPYVPSL